MSWRKKRVYKCAVCGCEEVGRGPLDTLDYSFEWDLPRWWRGEASKNGTCLCAGCYQAMEDAKRKQGKENR